MMKNHVFPLWLCIAALAPYASHAGETENSDPAKPVWFLLIENDWAGGTDENYTAGWKVGRTARARENGLIEGLSRRILRAGPTDDSYLQLALGQQIYTPSTQSVAEPLPDEHPYAGWLYGETSLVVDRGKRRPIDQLTLQFGVVGPAAAAEDVQNSIHRFNGQHEFKGWDNQIGNQPGLALTFERRWTGLGGDEGWMEWDLTPQAGATLGNVYISAQAGTTLRFGRDLDRPLGEPRNHPGLGGIAWHEEGRRQRPIYGFVGIEGRAVGHAIWIDGRPFQSDTVTQDSETFVYDVQGGVVLPLPLTNARMTASYIRRSSTFEGQDDAHGVGAISFAWRF